MLQFIIFESLNSQAYQTKGRETSYNDCYKSTVLIVFETWQDSQYVTKALVMFLVRAILWNYLWFDMYAFCHFLKFYTENLNSIIIDNLKWIQLKSLLESLIRMDPVVTLTTSIVKHFELLNGIDIRISKIVNLEIHASNMTFFW